MLKTLARIIKSFKYSIIGIIFCLRYERNFRIHTFAALTILYISPLYHFTTVQAAVLAITVFLVLIMEMLNTAVENTVDLITKDYHKLACIIKDLSAGAVGLSAISALIVGYFLLIKDIDFATTFAPLFSPISLTITITFLILGVIMVMMPLKKEE